MTTFVLIHGAWHGGWCWERIVPLLTAKGHRVLAPDLPGMGEDRTLFAEDVLGQWTDAVTDLVEAQAEPVVLVGHSRGGLLASTVAERVPDRVRLAVYLCAFMVADGETGTDLDVPTDAMRATISVNGRRAVLSIDPARAPAVFYGNVAPEVAAQAVPRLVDDPLQPHNVPVHLSAERYGRVPRAYIETTDDRSISLAKQRAMQARWRCDPVVSLPSDHSPFLSMPERLAQVLDDLAFRQVGRHGLGN